MEDVSVLLVLCLLLRWIDLSDTAIVQGNHTLGNLTCIYCEEIFTETWYPNTNCEAFPQQEPVRLCSVQDQYCRVERTQVKGTTVKILRECANECFYGCKVSGFAITKMICTSCCNTHACNTDNSSATIHSRTAFIHVSLTLIALAISSYFSRPNSIHVCKHGD